MCVSFAQTAHSWSRSWGSSWVYWCIHTTTGAAVRFMEDFSRQLCKMPIDPGGSSRRIHLRLMSLYNQSHPGAISVAYIEKGKDFVI